MENYSNIENIIDTAQKEIYLFGNKQKGLEILSNCIHTKPDDHKLWVKLGNANVINKHLDMAKICYDTALTISPNSDNALIGLSWYYFEQGKFKKAKELLYRTIEINQSVGGKFNLSLIYKLNKKYYEGLKLYESRKKSYWLKKHLSSKYLFLKQLPEFDINKTKKNSRILLVYEQGYGDILMYSRYIRILLKRGFKVSFICNEKLLKLFLNSEFKNNIEITSDISSLDFNKISSVAYLMSLPFYLYDNTIFKEPPTNFFINNDEYKFARLLDKNKINVGIAWSGRSSQPRELYRSLNYNFFKYLGNNSKINFYTLHQLNSEEDEIFVKKSNNFFDCRKYINCFYDTACFVKNMDFIISTCTSLVHLAGSLNKETYLLLSRIPDYRWGLRGKQYLYKSVQMIRQKKINDWSYPSTKLKEIIEQKVVKN